LRTCFGKEDLFVHLDNGQRYADELGENDDDSKGFETKRKKEEEREE